MDPQKKTYGINPKIRTRETVNQEYNFEIASAGHKLTTIKLLEDEIETHFQNAVSLRKEASKYPTEESRTETPETTTATETQEGGAA